MTRRTILVMAALSAGWASAALSQGAPLPNSIPTATMPGSGLPLVQTQETLSARTLVRLEQISRELTETIGRVEALEGALVSQKAENERLVALLDGARSSPTAPEAKVEGLSAAPAPVAQAEVSGNQAPSVAMFTPPTPPPLSPAIMLTNAQTALQMGSYQGAEANLTQLIWTHPASPEAAEGRWLLGEARFVQSAWGPAAISYVDYLKVTPQGPRASEALIRLAGAFRQLDDNRQRCLALAEFKRRTPRPDPTLKARADGEIARMTCPTP
jgi:TolA-binding protein